MKGRALIAGSIARSKAEKDVGRGAGEGSLTAPSPTVESVTNVVCHHHRHTAGESVFTSGPDSEMHVTRRISVSGLSGSTEN
jgi:hypothetical protein